MRLTYKCIGLSPSKNAEKSDALWLARNMILNQLSQPGVLQVHEDAAEIAWQGGDPTHTAKIDLSAICEVLMVADMLAAFSLETLFKACLYAEQVAHKGHVDHCELNLSHDLVLLADKINFELSAQERAVLEWLTINGQMGRYPVAKLKGVQSSKKAPPRYAWSWSGSVGIEVDPIRVRLAAKYASLRSA